MIPAKYIILQQYVYILVYGSVLGIRYRYWYSYREYPYLLVLVQRVPVPVNRVRTWYHVPVPGMLPGIVGYSSSSLLQSTLLVLRVTTLRFRCGTTPSPGV